MAVSPERKRWGNTPWSVDFRPSLCVLPERVDCAVIGGGFTGLAAAAWLRRLDSRKSVLVLEADKIGAGSSGHTGGIALGETAAGDLPGLGDVLSGLRATLKDLAVDCDLTLSGALEVGHHGGIAGSPISWQDSGMLKVTGEVAGGTIDPGKMLTGLARAAESAGAVILENSRLDDIQFGDPLRLKVGGREFVVGHAIIATNAQSLELSGIAGRAQPKFTLAVATKPLPDATLDTLGLTSRKPFYTIDLPYLWGRLLKTNGVVFGSGLIHLRDWRELDEVDVERGEAARLIALLEKRVRGLHSELGKVQFTHRWGGPNLFADRWRPMFERHTKSPRVIVIGGFSGHGVALSVHLGRWAAEAMTVGREMPGWAAR